MAGSNNAARLQSKSNFFGRHDQIYLYVPNLIGYARVLLSLTAFAVARTNPGAAFLFYFLSFVCDELDGRFARMLNQQSTLGAVLDMVTDRLSTAGLLFILGMLYPSYYMVALSLLFLDIFSHWFQTYSTVATGAATHKDVNSKSWLVRCYYKYRMFMGYCCISCEVLYLMIYLLHWPSYWQFGKIDLRLPLEDLPYVNGYIHSHQMPLALGMSILCIPGFIIKQITNVFQLRVAMRMLVAHDLQKNVQPAGNNALNHKNR